MKIGITPFGDNTKLYVHKMETENGICQFQVNGFSNEDELVRNVVDTIERAKNLGIDILCFPEMLGSEKILNKMQGILSQFPESEGASYPVLTICPTIWKNGENTTTVLNDLGEKVLEQSKQKAFEFEENGQFYREALNPKRHIQLIHCDGIGRLGILICRDAIEREYLQAMLDLLKVTLLIVPSFSTGYFDFSENLQACSAYDCCVVWINTCSALPENKKTPDDFVGFVSKTGKKTMFRNGQYCFKFSQCKKMKDGQACRECIYTEKLYFRCAGYE